MSNRKFGIVVCIVAILILFIVLNIVDYAVIKQGTSIVCGVLIGRGLSDIVLGDRNNL